MNSSRRNFAGVALVAGIDSSTQSCKVVICDADTGEIVRSAIVAASRRHRGRSAAVVVGAAGRIAAAGGLDDVAAVSVGAQQHGMVCLDASGTVVRDALLWNDTRSSDAAADLVAELGGPQEWAKRIGVVPVAAITAAKLRWLADHEPAHADATAAVCLPHDWLTWRLSGSTDIGDAAHRPQRRQRHRLLLVGGRRATNPTCSSWRCGGGDPHCPTVLGPERGRRGRRRGCGARARRRRQRRRGARARRRPG